MKRIVSSLLVITFAGCKTPIENAEPIAADKGAEIARTYTDLAEHKALEVSFTVHFVGPWDGTGYEQWSPDRFFCKLDSTTLIDSTFNNCHLVFVDNIWQSFPDPFHRDQLDFSTARKSSIDGTYLYHGGHGAEATASLDFKWAKKPSVDSTYAFTFTVPHDADTATLTFGTRWNEEPDNPTTYYLDNLQIKPLKKIPRLDSAKEDNAWLTFFSGSPDASQKAWQEIYSAHPDTFIERVAALVDGDADRRDYLIAQLEKGAHLPRRSIRKSA
jgi:hypothetical protein